MNLEEIKQYLRVDFEEDDSYISLLIDVSKEYIADAVGEYREENARHRLILLTLVSSLYENRQYTIDKNNEKVAYIIKSMIFQLQLGSDEE